MLLLAAESSSSFGFGSVAIAAIFLAGLVILFLR